MAKDVEVYDFDTKKVYLVAQEKLGAEMIHINLEGKIYWANSNQLTQNTYQHPPFEGELRQKISNIQKELESVNSQTYAEWEDGFRRDQNPKNEVAIWEHIVSVYRKFSKNYPDVAAKKEIYKIAVLCSYSEESAVLTQANVKVISSQVAQEIIAEYYK
ncbi:hypothetical protein [Cellvibrio fibrivorans]|uniref:Uncharacterized protein n=1 Tax=Cellvibrio fibrivorans TaxID=126350 RepID=A0ABU1UUN8_9GAMM|nr:hypothetical protein [Cellvibrio fibrivorans]MDR7088837.1 hypothetical protein [Cellvibrio fibrivorans]